MNRVFRNFIFVIIILFLTSSIGLTFGSTLPLDKAYKTWNKDKGKNAYLIGSFKMIHSKWNYYDPRIAQYGIEDVNWFSTFSLYVTLQNSDTNETLKLTFKPITSSTYNGYSEKLLLSNNDDPYWIAEVPPGNYALTTVTLNLKMQRPDYEPFSYNVVTVPLSRDIKRTIAFQANAKQIIYLGDYLAELKTNIVATSKNSSTDSIYPYNQFKIDLSANFDLTKTEIFNKADDSVKKSLSNFEFVSVL